MKKLLLALTAFAFFLPSIGLLSVALLVTPTAQTGCTPPVSAAGEIVFPLPAGTWVKTSDFGWRTDPVNGDRRRHSGTDYGAAAGTPILAIADGTVTHAGAFGTYGGLIIIEHSIAGKRIASAYAHMWPSGIHVTEGERVTAGQSIGDVGSAGRSTGPHLHLEIRPGGSFAPAVDAATWLADQGTDVLA